MLATPPARLVAVVALVALPLNVAVIVPALKLPDASRATTLLAVLAEVASTAMVPLLVIVPPVKNDPATIDVTVPLPVPAPIAVRKLVASSVVTVLSAFSCKNVTALGLANVNKFEPTVVAPKDVRPVGAFNPVAPPSHFKRSVYAVSQLDWLAVVGMEYPVSNATANVPELVTGEPDTTKPVGTVMPTEVTVPAPAVSQANADPVHFRK